MLATFLKNASLELGANRPQDAAAIAARLPQGTSVFVSHLPRHSLAHSLMVVQSLHEAGLQPVPHIAARRIGSKEELRSFLRSACGRHGVRRVLLIGGDLAEPAGPYADAEGVLTDPAVVDAGLDEVSFAVYPEEHARIPEKQLEAALERKIMRAAGMGLSVSLVTQLCFAPDRIVACINTVAARYSHLDLHIGIVGPTSLVSLARYAQTCGVATSLGALARMGSSSLRLATVSDPLRELEPVAAYLAAHPTPIVAGVHFFPFGGAIATADWITQQSTNLN
jgi:methylenetetrahydrofolate reductase (NADPH)